LARRSRLVTGIGAIAVVINSLVRQAQTYSAG
jgi:hypothetical protein